MSQKKIHDVDCSFVALLLSDGEEWEVWKGKVNNALNKSGFEWAFFANRKGMEEYSCRSSLKGIEKFLGCGVKVMDNE